MAEGPDDVVGFETIDLQDGNLHRLEDLLDPGHGKTDILGRCLTLRLVSGEGVVAEGLAMVEGNTQIVRLFLSQNLVQNIAETQDSRGVLSLGVAAGVVDQGIVRAIYQRVGIDEKEFTHNESQLFCGKITKK